MTERQRQRNLYHSQHREEEQERGKRHYQKNKESTLIRHAEYRAANLDPIHKQQAEYRRRTPEKQKEKSRRWRSNNPEKVKAMADRNRRNNRDKQNRNSALWALNNPEKKKAGKLRYRQEHPEKARKDVRLRRARELGVIFEPYTDAEIFALWGIDCHICGGPIDFEAPRACGQPGWEWGLQMDHVIPISKKGPDIKENVKPAHGKCNISKHDKMLDLLLLSISLPDTL